MEALPYHLIKYLFWNLAKVVDESNDGVFLQGISDAVDVHIPLIEQVVEDVHSLHSRGSLLLGAKNQVNPLV